MRPSLRKLWMTISIKRKIGIFAAMVILIMALSASFNVWITNVSLGSFGGILNDNSRCNDFQEHWIRKSELLSIMCEMQTRKAGILTGWHV